MEAACGAVNSLRSRPLNHRNHFLLSALHAVALLCSGQVTLSRNAVTLPCLAIPLLRAWLCLVWGTAHLFWDEQAIEHDGVRFLSSLYGGYWNYEVHDFCYMTNHYPPAEGLLEDVWARPVDLIKAYPSTNWYLSSLLAEPMGLSHRELVVGNGASELISAITQRFVENLAVPVPSFDEFINRARIQGKAVSPFTMTARFNLDIDEFISHVRSTRANSALLIRPNNPTGNYVSKAELTHFLDSMHTLDLILVDESFIEFVDAESCPSASDLMFEYPNLMILKSLSKNYGIPGLRLGYAAAGNADRIAALRNDLPIWNINSLAQFSWKSSVPTTKSSRNPVAESEQRPGVYTRGWRKSLPVSLSYTGELRAVLDPLRINRTRAY